MFSDGQDAIKAVWEQVLECLPYQKLRINLLNQVIICQLIIQRLHE